MVVIGVNFKSGGKVYYFAPDGNEVKVGDKVVVATSRGMELARVVQVNKEIDESQVQEEILPIKRVATNEDIAKSDELYKKYDSVYKTAKGLIDKYNLNMKLVDIEFPFEGGKVVINFTCEDRVDFRNLVKDLATTLKSRIDLRQIGIRDQAKTIGAIGICGQECCCKKYLSDFDKVSIKMAKTQNLSLNPTKISGMCGRLMCCLGYENDMYAESQNKMPKINASVSTPSGEGVVIYNDLLRQRVSVKIMQNDMPKILDFDVKEVKILHKDNK